MTLAKLFAEARANGLVSIKIEEREVSGEKYIFAYADWPEAKAGAGTEEDVFSFINADQFDADIIEILLTDGLVFVKRQA